MVHGKPYLEGSYGHILKNSIYLVKSFPISVRLCFQGLTFSHRHGQQGIQRLRNSVACHKSCTKSFSQLLVRAYWTLFQPIKPSHGNRPEARRKYFTHKGLISRVNGHSLVEMTHMLYGVSPSIINGKGQLGKVVWELGPINSACESWLGNLMQNFTHHVIPHINRGWALTSSPTMSFLFI